MTFMHIAIFINIVRLLKKIEIYLHTFVIFLLVAFLQVNLSLPRSLTDLLTHSLTHSLILRMIRHRDHPTASHATDLEEHLL